MSSFESLGPNIKGAIVAVAPLFLGNVVPNSTEFENTQSIATLMAIQNPENAATLYADRMGSGLTRSGPVSVTTHGQIIENLLIVSDGAEPGIDTTGFNDIIIRNVVVVHSYGFGINVRFSDRVKIDNVSVINALAPAFGKHEGQGAFARRNISVDGSDNFEASNVYVEKGSTGIYLLQSHDARLSNIEGFDMRGPFPSGHFVQFDKCERPILEDFAVTNPGETAWTEDGINSFGSTNPVIRRGTITGINSPTGNGVTIENGAGGSGGRVEDVTVINWANGAFMAGPKSSNVVFTNVRAFDGLAPANVSDSAGKTGFDGQPIPTLEQWSGSNYRGEPSSGQEAFLVYGASAPARFQKAVYRNLARENRIAWDRSLIIGKFREIKGGGAKGSKGNRRGNQ